MTYKENLEKAVDEVKKALPGMKMLENEEMRRHDSFRIGGPVRAFCAPKDPFALSKICSILHQNRIAPFILGNGTNLVIPDEGLDIFVISTERMQKLFLQEDGSIYAEAGVSLSKLAQFAQQNGLAGLEFASGIPGSVGGGVLMNAGAYGGELKDCVRSVVYYYLPEQALSELDNEWCGFSYRHSNFETMSCVITAAVFELKPGVPEEIAAKSRELNEKRRAGQPLDMPSAGSAFKRPAEGYAAAMIDEAGLKGFSIGGAQVSEKHAGFVVNKGGATYDDLVSLMEHVRKTVFEKTGVMLEPEVKIYPRGMTLADYSLDLRAAKAAKDCVEAMKKDGE